MQPTRDAPNVQLFCTAIPIINSITVTVSFTWPTLHSSQKAYKGKGSPITSKSRRGVAGFYAHHLSESWHSDGGDYHISVDVLPSSPQRRTAAHRLHLCSCSISMTETVPIKVPRPKHKAAVHSDRGLPTCAAAGFVPWTLAWICTKERSQRPRPSRHTDDSS